MHGMICDVERLIEALIGAEVLAQRKRAEDRAAIQEPRPVVTLSRGWGTPGRAVARHIADRLGICCYDREVLEQVARRARVDIELVRSLDEHARLSRGEWWQAVLKGQQLSRDDYRRHLVQVVVGIAHTGGVILGRGANFILGAGGAFRVRVLGSPERCADRLARQQGLDRAAARRRLEQVDGERARYIRRLYGADIDDGRRYDLVMNSDRLDVRGMVEVVMAGIGAAGTMTGNPWRG
jgi:cytidylate kinase